MSRQKTPRAPWERQRSTPAGRSQGPTAAQAGGRQARGTAAGGGASRSALPPELCVIGRHAVRATVEHQTDRCVELYHTDSPDLVDLVADAKARRIPTRQVDLDVIDALAGGREQGAAQGVVLSCAPFPYISVDEVTELPPVILALDGVEDPRNFGAAARAAYALGAGLVVVPADRAAQATAAAIKASAGALCRIPVAREVNFKRALEILKEKGAWIVGAEADGDRAPWDVDTTGHVVIVIGGEDRGLRRLTREACDFVTAIPMAAKDMSLNAADAATLLLYEALRQRTVDGKSTRPLPKRGS
jgi:23S rRNA (guanosine2251-2'-O)-methyltransferase